MTSDPGKKAPVSAELAWRLRVKRGLLLNPAAEYESERLAAIALRQTALMREFEALDDELKELAGERARQAAAGDIEAAALMAPETPGLTPVALEDATPDMLEQLGAIVDQQLGYERSRKSGHTCWTYVPTKRQLEMLAVHKVLFPTERCPECGKGQIVLEIFKGDVAGDGLWLKCYWGATECKWRQAVHDPNDPED